MRDACATCNFCEHHHGACYCAGALPVVVHNEGDWCGKLLKKWTEIVTRSGDDIGRYCDYLVEMRENLDPRLRGWIDRLIPDKIWNQAAKNISQHMMDAVKVGDIPWTRLPTVADWDSRFYKRPPNLDYGL